MNQPRVRRWSAGRARTLGTATRGTTNPQRLRRNDRWICSSPQIAAALSVAGALAIDLGYGATPVTTIELCGRLSAVFPAVRVLGLEIDPERVTAAQSVADPPRLTFARGGFELAGQRPQLVRAMNVLRQYDEVAALQAWSTMIAGLGPAGVLVEGTCDEIGRICSWVLLDASGPVSLTLACSAAHLDHPRTLAERLPKALIHHNVDGQPIAALLADLGRQWDAAAPLAVYSARQRWMAAVAGLPARWSVLSSPKRHRLGELTVPWPVVAPV